MTDASLQMNDSEWNMMVIPLKFTWQPTENELNDLKKLVCLRMNQRELISIKQQDSTTPSVIIDDFLYHGDLKHAMNKTLLEVLGIRRIINVCDYPLEQDILDQYHILWINLEDDTYVDIAEYFKTTNEFLHTCKLKGEKVLVNCQMGVSRSSSIVLAYLMKYHHSSLDKAYDYLVERRRCAEPNLGFLLQLIRYERELHKIDETVPSQNNNEKDNSIETSDAITTSTENKKQHFSKYIFLSLLFIFLLLFLIYSIFSPLKLSQHKSNQHQYPRGVIVTLIRSTNTSIHRVINMIHSVVLFHSSQNLYPVIIFHDQYFTSSMQQYILSCVSYSNKTLQISFILFHFPSNISLPAKFMKRLNLGYHVMCRFWSYDVFYHPAIKGNHYEYLMRMDDDSYFIDHTKDDLFEYTKKNNLDYVYRSRYKDDCPGLSTIEARFFKRRRKFPRRNCIYNNFFLIRLQWFYQSARVQSFSHQLIENDFMLKEYIGDGCVHAVWFDLDRNMKTKEIKTISYGHNSHIMLANDDNFLSSVRAFSQQMENSCHQLILIENRKKQLKLIEIS
ncbi:hypothetical protein I4U23_004925 [Adineta vaga]|nr:hypothetical protein I4U23_004925 [Adineta vaga]